MKSYIIHVTFYDDSYRNYEFKAVNFSDAWNQFYQLDLTDVKFTCMM